MYRAKWDGKNRYVMFESGMQDVALTRLKLDAELRQALKNEEFFLVYQPDLQHPRHVPEGHGGADSFGSTRRAGSSGRATSSRLLEETGLNHRGRSMGPARGLPTGRALDRSIPSRCPKYLTVARPSGAMPPST